MSTRAQQLLDWYDRERRDLPWRMAPGKKADPYKVWMSEIMLQQTTVATVKSYYRDFLQKWPTVQDLAGADLDEVLHAWQGLGYYARARNLHKCASVVTREYNGRFPEEEKRLLELPGIGPYTAAAIASIAFGAKATPVDGNVERVVSRLFQVEEKMPKAKKQLAELASTLTPEKRAGDFAQAMMDLGATVCSPKKAACGICPWMEGCEARLKAEPTDYPKKEAKKPKPTRKAYVFWLTRKDGAVLLRRRPEKGLLGGMMEIPSSEWSEADITKQEALRHSPASALLKELEGGVRHTFTHFHLELTVLSGRVNGNPPVNGVWVLPEDLKDHALPTLMKKVSKHALTTG
ncbi:A/G-specific adenine glycosylase [Candidatus Terasakiella magnetica]|uniref:Adenine DNA glycosylase n=1 Tax=Candidatus Terasakiella magnetica TaxID=1867952 RepID=A0A1C3RJI1_9PROT|nr:A/G-specific adenine glycosylase [Candidatus Terasakiella magnetica]SCA57387.1 A/G-specific adenine glycosylase [Candidatus Terasakiella magnetica]